MIRKRSRMSRTAVLALICASAALAGCAEDKAAAVVETGDGQVSEAAAPATTAGPEPAAAQVGDDYASVWGPAVGSRIPRIAASDHLGAAQTLKSLRGENGLLLVFGRSADW